MRGGRGREREREGEREGGEERKYLNCKRMGGGRCER